MNKITFFFSLNDFANFFIFKLYLNYILRQFIIYFNTKIIICEKIIIIC